jgi:hypothetical protein
MADSVTKASSSADQNDGIQLNSCRKCSTSFEYQLSSGGVVSISVGIPSSKAEYKAISHVWGKHGGIDMRCINCDAIYSPSLRSAESFRRLMEGAGAGSTVWLDNLSINQEDHNDVATQIAVMGDTYRNAKRVLVFLPPQDEDAYLRLAKLLELAMQLLDRKWQFDFRGDETVGEQSAHKIQETNTLGIEFYKSIFRFREATKEYLYWSRAWTFQEWAVADELEIICDSEDRSKIHKPLDRLKSRIVFAAIMMADYRLRFGDSSLMKLGFHRGEAKPFVDTVKRLFPFENAFAIIEEIDVAGQRAQIAVPGFGTNLILGLRGPDQPNRSNDMQFRSRLSLMLDSFVSGNGRKATFEADKVACWSSMCGIMYDYSKHDSAAGALGKAIRSIRSRGITVYNFHVNGDAEDVDVDLEFFKYAASHEQSNASNRGLFPGIPAFTGRTDTTIHFKKAMAVVEKIHELGAGPYLRLSDTIRVEGIKDAAISGIVKMSDFAAVKIAMSSSVSGLKDGFMFRDAFEESWEDLESVQSRNSMVNFLALHQTRLVVVVIPTDLTRGSDSTVVYAWAICSHNVPFDSMFVGRESLNGTLVLAVAGEMNETALVAYLVITDHESGTFLIKSDEDGKVDLLLQTPQRSDMGVIENKRDRRLQMQLAFRAGHTMLPDLEDLEDLVLRSGLPTDLVVPVKVDRNKESIPSLSRAGTQFDNNAALTSCERYMEQTIRTTYEMSKAGKSTSTSLTNLWPGLSGSIIGHPDVISEEQQMQDDILRRTAAVATDVTQKLKDSMCMTSISSGRYNFQLAGFQKPSYTEDKELEEGSTTSASARRDEQPLNLDDLLARVTFRPSLEDRGIPSSSQERTSFSDRELLNFLMSAAANEDDSRYNPGQGLDDEIPKCTTQ